MTAFKNTEIIKFTARRKDYIYGDRNWGKWQQPVTIQEYGAINKISISPCDPHYFAITSSSKVLIYDPVVKDVFKTLANFKEAAFGAKFRRDGKLLCAGTSEGEIKVFDITTKTMLRILKGHTAATHRCEFTSDNYHVVSFCDDKTVGIWDLATETRTNTLTGHTDYVRCGVTASGGSDLLVSGSYDQTVALWDKRTPGKPVVQINHGAPVEDVILLSGDSLAVSAGGNHIKIWDLTAGGKRLTSVSPHHKTVTSLCLADGGQSIISASLDRQVKRISTSDFSTTGSMSFPSSVLSVDVHPNNNYVVAGMADGLVQIIERKKELSKDEKTASRRRSNRYRQFTHFTANTEDILVKEEKKRKEAPYDLFLRKYEYTQALDYALNKARVNPTLLHSVLFELMRREGLQKALAGRDEESIKKIINYIYSHLKDPRFQAVLLHVANMLVDMYMVTQGGTSEPIMKSFSVILLTCLEKKLQVDKDLIKLQGCIDLVLATADTGHQNTRIEKELLMKKS